VPLTGTDDAVYSRYDVYSRKTWEIGALGANGLRMATRTTYRDSDDRALYAESGTIPDANSTNLTVLNRTDLTYDAYRNPIRAAVSAGGTVQAVTEKAWDDRGRLVCTAIRMNPAQFGAAPGACALTTTGSQGPDRITLHSYDAASQLLQEVHAYGTAQQQNEATYTYSANGKQLSLADANGNKASMTYDGFDRQIRWNFPSPTSTGTVSTTDYEAYTYDAVGNRLSLRKRDATTLTFSYDNLNRITLKTVPTSASGAAGYSVYFGYDLRNAQLYARFGSASGAGITNSYDGFGRLATISTNMDGTARTITYTSDVHGNHTGVSGNFGYYTGYTFDASDRALTLLDSGGTQVRMSYDSAGRPSRLDSGAGLTSSANVTYDAMSRMATLGHDFAGTASDQSFGFGYNAASQIVQRTSSNDAYASNTAYAVNRNYSVNGLNQYTAAGTASFTYDANGNLTSDGANAYVYDAENRLVSATGAHNATLAYDPAGRLWQLASGSSTTRFIYDGDALIWETDGAGNPRQAYAHGPNAAADDPLIWYDGNAGFLRRFLHMDHQGSIIATADDGGSMVAINAYDPWGIPNAANVGRFQYTGQAWLSELGMYYYKARIYSPTLGRFLQTDPIGYAGGNNLYAYVGDDPVNGSDPDGTTPAPVLQAMSHGEDLLDSFLNALTALAIAVDIADTPVSPTPDVSLVAVGLRREIGSFGRTEVRQVERDAIKQSTLRPGPHARESIPGHPGPPTAAEQREINRIGDTHGCHTCGAREPGRPSGNWTGDHQQPSALNPQGTPQRFYPHCDTCRRRQAGEVTQEVMRRRREGER
jgi:RHS repeat-associated protein